MKAIGNAIAILGKCPARINGRSCRRIATTPIESTLGSSGLAWSLKQDGLLCSRCAENFERIRAHIERVLNAHYQQAPMVRLNDRRIRQTLTRKRDAGKIGVRK